MIIAIDGPAASGKGTLGKRLAHHYGYRHLDTGVIYRAVAKALLDEGFDLTDEARDKNRAAAPLKAAADAHILDNSNLDIEGGVRAAIAIVEAVRAGRGSFR